MTNNNGFGQLRTMVFYGGGRIWVNNYDFCRFTPWRGMISYHRFGE